MSIAHATVKLRIPESLVSFVSQTLYPMMGVMKTEMIPINGQYKIHLPHLRYVKQFEQLLDNLRIRHPVIRYHMFIYDSATDWPRSVRINDQGNKIITTSEFS